MHLSVLADRFGEWVYGILVATVFAEAGLVVTPFLPGHWLLFAAGALAGAGGCARRARRLDTVHRPGVGVADQ